MDEKSSSDTKRDDTPADEAMPLDDAIAALTTFRGYYSRVGKIVEYDERVAQALDVVLGHARRTNPWHADPDVALTHAFARLHEALDSGALTLNQVAALGFAQGTVARMRGELAEFRRAAVETAALKEAIVHLECVWAEESNAQSIDIDRVTRCIVKVDRALTGGR